MQNRKSQVARDPLAIRPATRADLPVIGRLAALLVRLHQELDPHLLDTFLSPCAIIKDPYFPMKTRASALGRTWILPCCRRGIRES